MLLSEKVIVVTGGASGIGYECVKAYQREGARVAILDIRPLPGPATMEDPTHHPQWLLCDVSNEEDVKDSFRKILERYGTIDCIHNNAAISSPSKPLHTTSVEEWHRIMNTNLLSIYLTTKYGLGSLIQSKGSIINTSSLVGEMGQELHAVYAASKGAVNALTKSMALDYAHYGIRVNAVAPAGVWTPMLKQWAREQPNPRSIENYLDGIHALGYCPNGNVVADAAVFLASGMASFITGCILPVGGGAELGYKLVSRKAKES
jgi:NAD(P)-dependent dehydrogenase (short-subunit alcohol dehydrogenase family)